MRVIQVSSKGATQQGVIPIGQHDLLELVELSAGDGNAVRTERRPPLGRIRDAEGAAAFDPVIVTLGAQLEPASRQLQALRIVRPEIGANLQEDVLLPGIRQRGGGAQADAASVTVIGDAAIDERTPEYQIERILLVSDIQTDFPDVAIAVELRAKPRRDADFGAWFRDPFGDVVDDTAGGTDAFCGRRPVDYLDAFDGVHVGEGTAAGAVAQRCALWNAVKQTQRLASAQRFADRVQFLRRFGVAGHGPRKYCRSIFG